MTLMSLVNPDMSAEIISNLKDATYKEIMDKPMMTGEDIMRLPCEPNDYLVENMLWKDNVCLVLAREKVGKTFFTSQMCYAMTVGKPFLGQFDVCKPLNILYIQAEGSMGDTKDRINNSMDNADIEWDPKRWRHIFVPAIHLNTDEGYNHIIEAMATDEEFVPDVIVIDPLYQALKGSLSDELASRDFVTSVRRIMAKFHCAILLIHHEHRGKKNQMGDAVEEGDDSIMGSFVWKAFVNHVLRLTWDKKGTLRKMNCTTQRNGNVVEKLDIDLVKPYGIFVIPNSGGSSGSEDVVFKNIEYNEITTCNSIMEQTGMAMSTVRKCFTRLMAKGLIERGPKQGQNVTYQVKEGK